MKNLVTVDSCFNCKSCVRIQSEIMKTYRLYCNVKKDSPRCPRLENNVDIDEAIRWDEWSKVHDVKINQKCDLYERDETFNKESRW